jgi:pimeloyl-ACP methyl ester carboxylesterase
MHGKKDKTVPYDLAEELHAGIKGSKMLACEGGHIFFLMKERQRFLDTVAEFVQ